MRMDKIIIDQTGIKQQVINEICELAQKYIRGYVIIESTYLDRNVTHSYNQNIALSIISQAKEKFYDMFCQLKKEIDENWI